MNLFKVMLLFIITTTLGCGGNDNGSEKEDKQYPKTSILKNSSIAVLYQGTDIPKPAKGQSVNDQVLGTKITQINKHVIDKSFQTPYPKVQAWNKDMSLLRIHYKLYDTNTYEESTITKGKNGDSGVLCSGVSDYTRWSNKDPNSFFLIQNYIPNKKPTFIAGKIEGNHVNCSDTVTFADYDILYMTLEEGNIDYNDQYVAMLGKKKDDSRIYILLYDIKNRKQIWTKVLPAEDDDKWIKKNNQWLPKRIDWVSVSPSGKYIVINSSHVDDDKNGMYVYSRETFGNKKRLKYKLADNSNIIFTKGEHGDLGYDQQGNEVWVQFIAGYGVFMFNIEKPDEPGQELLIGPASASGGHISCRNTDRPGWCYVTTYNYDYAYAFALKLEPDNDGTNSIAKENVELFSRTYIRKWYNQPGDTPMDYPFGSVSPDGTKIMFTSRWGINTQNTGAYVAELQEAN